MRRLNTLNLNKPETVETVFKNRWREQMHYIDWPRYQRLVRYYEKGRFLDLGCFNSPLAYEIKLDYPEAEVWAVDNCPYLIEVLSKRFPEVKYEVRDALDNKFENEYFDYIVMGELLEHIEKPKDLIAETMRIIKPGGYLALSTPYKETAETLLSAEHLWAFGDDDIIEFLEPYGEVTITHYRDSNNVIIAYCKKHETKS